MDYCSRIPPHEQVAGSMGSNPPSVMVPVPAGVLKKDTQGLSKKIDLAFLKWPVQCFENLCRDSLSENESNTIRQWIMYYYQIYRP